MPVRRSGSWHLLAFVVAAVARFALERSRPEPVTGSGALSRRTTGGCPAGRSPAGRHRVPRRRTWMLLAASVLLGTGLALVSNVALFYFRYRGIGGRLLAQEQRLITAGRAHRRPTGRSAGTCSFPPGPAKWGDAVQAELVVPSLGLRAPVVQGVGQAQLAEAVGHVTSSVWPGSPGTVVLAAHNVSWFSRIDRLRAGNRVQYVTPCATYSYRVTAHQVVPAGSAVTSGSAQVLVLDTCYPLDALWFTSRRYLVTATLEEPVPQHAGEPLGVHPVSPVRGPRTTSAAGSAFGSPPATEVAAQPSVPMGRLHLAGSPGTSFDQSLAPIDAETAFVQRFEHSLAGGLAGSSAPLGGARVESYSRGLSVTLVVEGSQVRSAAATAVVVLGGGVAPGTYRLSFSAMASGGGWTAGALSATPWSS